MFHCHRKDSGKKSQLFRCSFPGFFWILAPFEDFLQVHNYKLEQNPDIQNLWSIPMLSNIPVVIDVC
jgi:hypothetical protein